MNFCRTFFRNMKKFKHIYRLRISDFELEILEICKKNKIKPADFIRVSMLEKAEKDFKNFNECPF